MVPSQYLIPFVRLSAPQEFGDTTHDLHDGDNPLNKPVLFEVSVNDGQDEVETHNPDSDTIVLSS